jgi:hypothetical protein
LIAGERELIAENHGQLSAIEDDHRGAPSLTPACNKHHTLKQNVSTQEK